MKIPFAEWDESTRDLAVEEVTFGLSGSERDELLARLGSEDLEQLEASAAALNLAGLGKLEAPPSALMCQLQFDSRAHFGFAGSAPATSLRATETRSPRSTWLAHSGWLAAAILFVAFLLQNFSERPQDSATSREILVASAPDLVRAEWLATPDPLAGNVSGDVVWSNVRQEGYMRFRDLAPNDPRQLQYQLWIFDKSRDGWEAKPVDGGVFDVGRSEEVIVRIDAKLEVRDAALFAVTLERPGGVVVSAREHLLATAAPK